MGHAIVAVLVLLVALLGAILPAALRPWLDRAILLALGLLAVALVSGMPLIVLAGGPADPLHFLYALLLPWPLDPWQEAQSCR